ncbi:MAG: hypothetical protein OHK0038_13140 [Flammeovirgaceae bacterium]
MLPKKISKILLISILISVSCKIDKDKPIDITQARFQTTNSSILFFRNIRVPYYDKVEMDEAKMNQFRLKERNLGDSIPIINLCILEAWLRDEAYIYIEPNKLLTNTDTLSIIWKDPLSDSTGVYHFVEGDREMHYRFATQIYTSIQKQHSFFVKIDDKICPFMQNESDRETFRKTLVDFYRLVGAIK